MHMSFRPNRRRGGHLLAVAFACASLAVASFAPVAVAADAAAATKPAELTLITATPEAGFALAVKLSQKGVGAVQPNVETRKQLRPEYANDPDSLIAVSHVIATHFQTIAAANDYWRKPAATE